MSRCACATRSTLQKFLGIELKNVLINCSNVSRTWLIHDLICATISRTYALMCLSTIASFCILLSGIIHSTSLLFEIFLIEPSEWTKHKGTVYKGYLRTSSKLISRLALIDNDNNFPMIYVMSNFVFGRVKWKYFIYFSWLMKWHIFRKDSLLWKFICLNFIIRNIK